MTGHLHEYRANERTSALGLPGFYPSVESRHPGRTVSSRTWRFLRTRNPSRQRQEAMRSSPLSGLMLCNRRATAGSVDPQRRIAFCRRDRIAWRPTVMRSLRLHALCRCGGWRQLSPWLRWRHARVRRQLQMEGPSCSASSTRYYIGRLYLERVVTFPRLVAAYDANPEPCREPQGRV